MRFSSICLAGFLMAAPAFADEVSTNIDAAKGSYGRGDGLHALTALQTATAQLTQQLGAQLAKALPPTPAGWEAAGVEWQGLEGIGSGLTVTQAYSKGDATLNLSLIIDNASVTGSGQQPANRPGWSKVHVGSEEALLRFDPATRAGEVLIQLGDRALLQIEGNEITSENLLIDTAKGWNVSAVKRLLQSGNAPAAVPAGNSTPGG